MQTQGRRGIEFEDRRSESGIAFQFYENLDPIVKEDTVDGIIQNTLNPLRRKVDTAWVRNKNLEDRMSQKGIYVPWKQDLIDKQTNNSNQFLLESFKRARSVGYPIHPLLPYLSGLPSTAFEGQAGL